jgi:UDP-glucose:(heptosyl)LPS alpha-1,3-glucosyltransferase
MKLKVAIIIERADTALGGAERSVFEMAEALASLDLDVHILAAKGRMDANNVHFLCPDIPGKRTSHSRFAAALKEHLAENHYDIVHSILPFDFIDVYQPRDGAYIESALQKAASFSSRFMQSFKKATAFLNLRRAALIRAERQLVNRPDGPIVAAISNYVAMQFRQHYGLNVDRITVILNGVKTAELLDKGRVDRLRGQILTELGLKESDHPVLFLFAGHNFKRKGLGCLIKAMQLVSTKATDGQVFLVIAGGDRTTGYLRLARKLNVYKQVLFLGKVSNIAETIAAADVAVLPTFYDPCSRFILEALAGDKPVITTKYNGAIDFFIDNRHGRVIDSPNDVSALADALIYFIEPANIRKASRAIIEDNIKQNVSITRLAGQLKVLYERIPAKRRRQ